MSRKAMVVAGVSLVAAVLAGLFVVLPAFAQEATPGPAVPSCQRAPGWGQGFGFFSGGEWSAFDATADALGLTPEELFSQLHAGNSLEEIAKQQGVELESVREAVDAVRANAMRDRIQQAVENGDISQEQADWLLQGLDKGFMPMKGRFGGGMRGGMRGGRFNRAPGNTTSAPRSSS